MKKKFILVLLFVMLFSFTAYASVPNYDDIVDKYKDCHFILYKNVDDEYCLVIYKNVDDRFSIKENETDLLIWAGDNRDYNGYEIVDGSWKLFCDGKYTGFHTYDKDSLIDTNYDTFLFKTTTVFFSPPVHPVEELPGMVIPDIVKVAGVGILLISLMLLPVLLKKLFNFL